MDDFLSNKLLGREDSRTGDGLAQAHEVLRRIGLGASEGAGGLQNTHVSRNRDLRGVLLPAAQIVVKRLVQGRMDDEDCGRGRRVIQVTAAEQKAFVQLILQPDTQSTTRFARRLIAKGVPLSSVYTDLLTASARQLGDMWDDDTLDFGKVTLATYQLTQVFRALQEDKPACPVGVGSAAILLATLPGSQHTLGVQMLGDLFEREAWNVRLAIAEPIENIADVVAVNHFDVVGISVSALTHIPQLHLLMKELRTKSLNPLLSIVLGGALVSTKVGVVDDAGADFVTCDPDAAIDWAAQAVRSARNSNQRVERVG